MRRIPHLLVSSLLLAACAPEPEPTEDPVRPIATVMEVMDAVTIPASDEVWLAAAEPPETEEEWEAVRHAALALAESGNLLLMEGRTLDRDEWITETIEFIDAAVLAVEAAAARNLNELIEAGDAIYDTCLSCHQIYMHPQYNEP